MIGLIGRKMGMTQIFSERGMVIPITVIEAGPCQVLQVKTTAREKYSAVQLGFGETKERLLNKPLLGHLGKHGALRERREDDKVLKTGLRHLREFRLDEGHELKTGDTLTVEQFPLGTRVDVVGTSKGRGFQGVVKRHHFKGGPETHGCKTHDMPGSIGSSAWPSHVWKGVRLPGQMGNKRNTAQNLKVVRIDPDRNLLMVEGAVPGGSNSLVVIRPSYKTRKGRKS